MLKTTPSGAPGWRPAPCRRTRRGADREGRTGRSHSPPLTGGPRADPAGWGGGGREGRLPVSPERSAPQAARVGLDFPGCPCTGAHRRPCGVPTSLPSPRLGAPGSRPSRSRRPFPTSFLFRAQSWTGTNGRKDDKRPRGKRENQRSHVPTVATEGRSGGLARGRPCLAERGPSGPWEEPQVLVTSAHLRAGGAGVSRDRGLLSPGSQPWRPSGWGAA